MGLHGRGCSCQQFRNSHHPLFQPVHFQHPHEHHANRRQHGCLPGHGVLQHRFVWQFGHTKHSRRRCLQRERLHGSLLLLHGEQVGGWLEHGRYAGAVGVQKFLQLPVPQLHHGHRLRRQHRQDVHRRVRHLRPESLPEGGQSFLPNRGHRHVAHDLHVVLLRPRSGSLRQHAQRHVQHLLHEHGLQEQALPLHHGQRVALQPGRTRDAGWRSLRYRRHRRPQGHVLLSLVEHQLLQPRHTQGPHLRRRCSLRRALLLGVLANDRRPDDVDFPRRQHH